MRLRKIATYLAVGVSLSPAWIYGRSCPEKFNQQFPCDEILKTESFSFSDGTKFKNPFFIQPPNLDPKSLTPVLNNADLSFEIQLELMQLVDELRPPASREFQLGFNQLLSSELALIVDEKEASNEIFLLWPPSSRGKTRTKVPAKQVRDYFKEHLNADQYKQFSELLRKSGKLIYSLEPSAEPILPLQNEKSQARVEKIFSETKRHLEKVILNGRPKSSLSPAEQALIDRVTSTKLRSIQEASSLAECAGNARNASYLPLQHSVFICPAFYDYPESTLVTIIAHEISHSIDPCRSQFPLYSLDSGILNDYDPHAEANSTEVNDVFQLIKAATESSNKGILMLELSLDSPKKDQQSIEALFNLTPLSPGVTPQNYPYKNTKACFEKAGFYSTRWETISNEFELLHKNTPRPEKIHLQKQYKTLFDKHPECLEITKKSQMNETLSDYFAARVLDFYQREHPPKTENDHLAPVLYFALNHCEQTATSKTSIVNAPVVSGTSALAQIERLKSKIGTVSNDEHPEHWDRISKIYLSSPQLAKAWNCNPGPGSTCFPKSTTPGTSPQSPLETRGVR